MHQSVDTTTTWPRDGLPSALSSLTDLQQAGTLSCLSENVIRALNFMHFELVAICEKLEGWEKLNAISHYFFRTKAFQVLPLTTNEITDKHILFESVIANKAGAPIGLTMIYAHLCQLLNIPTRMLSCKSHYLLATTVNDQCLYVNICKEGELLSENSLISLLGSSLAQPVPQELILNRYLEELGLALMRTEQTEAVLKTYSILIQLNPQDTRWLARRGYYLHQLGRDKEALADFKKYLCFMDLKNVPETIMSAYQKCVQDQTS